MKDDRVHSLDLVIRGYQFWYGCGHLIKPVATRSPREGEAASELELDHYLRISQLLSERTIFSVRLKYT